MDYTDTTIHRKRPFLMILFVIMGLGILGGVVYGSYWYGTKHASPVTPSLHGVTYLPAQSPTLTTSANASNTPTPTSTYAGWLTYSNKIYNYSIKYPQDWALDSTQGDPGPNTPSYPACKWSEISLKSPQNYTLTLIYN